MLKCLPLLGLFSTSFIILNSSSTPQKPLLNLKNAWKHFTNINKSSLISKSENISTYRSFMQLFTIWNVFAPLAAMMGTTPSHQNVSISTLQRQHTMPATNVTTWNRWQYGFSIKRWCGWRMLTLCGWLRCYLVLWKAATKRLTRLMMMVKIKPRVMWLCDLSQQHFIKLQKHQPFETCLLSSLPCNLVQKILSSLFLFIYRQPFLCWTSHQTRLTALMLTAKLNSLCLQIVISAIRQGLIVFKPRQKFLEEAENLALKDILMLLWSSRTEINIRRV